MKASSFCTTSTACSRDDAFRLNIYLWANPVCELGEASVHIFCKAMVSELLA